MAQSALQIPEPLSEDPEAVATALETAAIFGAQGDAREALRWLRRAAELASDDGQDMRALNLARQAADLSTRIQTSSAPPRQSGPPSAPRQSGPSGPPPAPSQREAPNSGRNLRGLPPLEAARGPAVVEAPPPPPPPPLPPPHQSLGRAARETYAEASRRVDAETEALTTPRRRMTDPGPGPVLDLRGGLPPFNHATLQAVPEPEPELTLPRAESAPAAPPPAARAEMISSTDERPTPIPEPPPDASPGALFRQTVRVSVAPNAAKPGTFVVELLEEDEAVAEGSDEALLVLLNPHTQVLQGG